MIMNIEADHETMESETPKKLGSRLTDMGRKVARQATEVAHESLDTVRTKAGAAVNLSQDYAREHTVPILLGTLAIGFAAGYLVALLERPSNVRRRYILDTPIRRRSAESFNRMGNYVKFW